MANIKLGEHEREAVGDLLDTLLLRNVLDIRSLDTENIDLEEIAKKAEDLASAARLMKKSGEAGQLLTGSDQAALRQMIENNLFDVIRADTEINNINWISSLMQVYQRLGGAEPEKADEQDS